MYRSSSIYRLYIRIGSTNETSRRNMPSYSCLSSRHLPTRLLQLCPLRSVFIHTTTLILGTTHCCSSNKRSVIETTSHLHRNNCTGFPSMPVLHSKSPSSCITSILEPLHHTCHPWLRHALLPGPEDSDHPCVGILL